MVSLARLETIRNHRRDLGRLVGLSQSLDATIQEPEGPTTARFLIRSTYGRNRDWRYLDPGRTVRLGDAMRLKIGSLGAAFGQSQYADCDCLP